MYKLIVTLNEHTEYGYFKEFENKNKLIDEYNKLYNSIGFKGMKRHTKYGNGDEEIEILFNKGE